MAVPFLKYHGTGNDFVMVDNRNLLVDRDEQALFASWCDRRFGIGADGVILLQNHPAYDFEMVYINADGREGSMCGNGGRCVVQFAHDLGVIDTSTRFLAVDGEHTAVLSEGLIHLAMQPAGLPSDAPENGFYLNTGSPHHLVWVENLPEYDVEQVGKALRWHNHYAPGGTNVNFVERLSDNSLRVRTYERGVEAETYSCGTGVTAAALLLAYQEAWPSAFEVAIATTGGHLKVQATRKGHGFEDIHLIGPAKLVFQGLI